MELNGISLLLIYVKMLKLCRYNSVTKCWTVNKVTQVQFMGSAGHFHCDWSWKSFYSHWHCMTALAFTEITNSSLQKWRHLVAVKHLTVCPGKVQWLNSTLINSMRHWPDLEGTTHTLTKCVKILNGQMC